MSDEICYVTEFCFSNSSVLTHAQRAKFYKQWITKLWGKKQEQCGYCKRKWYIFKYSIYGGDIFVQSESPTNTQIKDNNILKTICRFWTSISRFL